ncbi:MAG: F0F1 ATP synthase subunit B' [Hellea sp.]
MLNAITLMGLKLAAAKPSGDHGGEHAAEGVFPPFDPTYFATQIFWLLLTFGILYLLLSRIFLPRIGQTLEDRSSRIADDLDAASRMQKDAEEAGKAYERALADARAKAHNVAETTRQAVDAEIKGEMEAADAIAAKAAEAAEERIRGVRAKAMANIESVAADAAQAAVETLTGKKLTLASVKKALN